MAKGYDSLRHISFDLLYLQGKIDPFKRLCQITGGYRI
jgi:hypothetical protein